MAPAVVVAYNFFMNGVDRMDQARSVNPAQRRKKTCRHVTAHMGNRYCLPQWVLHNEENDAQSRHQFMRIQTTA
jgi:hypothetical protein